MVETRSSSPISWRKIRSIALRRRWSFLGPYFALGFLGIVAAQVWPVLYRSNALILIQNRNALKPYVNPNIEPDFEARLQSMTEQILSRRRLEKLINKLNLYADQRGRVPMDEIADGMRKAIEVDPMQVNGQTGDLTGFQISYAAASPQIAQQVVQELSQIFVDENTQTTNQQSSNATVFLSSQLDQARQTLQDKQQILQNLKMKYLGELPEQEQANLQILNGLQTEYADASAALDRDVQQRAYLETVGSEMAVAGGGSSPASSAPAVDPEIRLTQLKAQLANLEARYTSRYPDVVRTKDEIAALEAELHASPNSRRPAKSSKALPSSQGTSQLRSLQIEIADRSKDLRDLRSRINDLETRLNTTPVRAQELSSATQDVADAQQYYQSLLKKESDSQLSTNLDEQQSAGQFQIINSASLPLKPAPPNRLEIMLAGWVLGIAGGIGTVALRECTETRLITEGDIRSLSRAPILASVPVLLTPREEREARGNRILEFGGVATLLIVAIVVGAYTILMG